MSSDHASTMPVDWSDLSDTRLSQWNEPCPLPFGLIDRLKKWALDKTTGNVKLNVKDGRIVGFHMEEIVSLKP